MTRSVRLVFFTQTLGCETCVQARQILDELPPLSDRITIEEVNLVLDTDKVTQYGVDRAPSIAIVAHDDAGDHETRIRFAGTPSGYEFSSLIHAVMDHQPPHAAAIGIGWCHAAIAIAAWPQRHSDTERSRLSKQRGAEARI